MKKKYWDFVNSYETKSDKIIKNFNMALNKAETIEEVQKLQRQYDIQLHKLYATGYSEDEEITNVLDNLISIAETRLEQFNPQKKLEV